MRAIVWDRGLEFFRDYPVPKPAAGEALIRVLLAGICSTDLEIMKGYAGFSGIPGHEFVGVVEEVNGGAGDLVGKRVVGEINIGCGDCEYCRAGLKEHCASRRVLGIRDKDGAMADYVTLPVANLHIVPSAVPDEAAVFTEPLAAAFRVSEQVRFNSGDHVRVMGDGKLGLMIAFALASLPIQLVLSGKHENKLRIARTKNITTILSGESGPEKYEVVIEATGSARGFEKALALVKPRGTLVLKSTVAERREMNLFPIVVNEITVIGSRCGPFGPALKALANGDIDVRPLIFEIFPAEKALKAFDAAAAKESLKILIDFR